MKNFLRKLVLWMLVRMARFRLRKYTGTVIAVTGSVGKTSTKEAIFSVLNTQFKVKKTKKSMNSEFGLPLTILDIDSGYSSATKWSWFLIKAAVHCFMKEYSEVLLLEFGVDKPGDMDFLMKIVKPDIAVMTNIAPAHIDEGQFKDVQSIFDEKSKIVSKLGDDGKAILNIDNPYIAGLVKKLGRRKSVTFGVDRDADFRASQIKSSLEGSLFTLHHNNKRTEVHSGVLGDFQVYVLLPAIACGMVMGMSLEQTLYGLSKFKSPPGRLNLIEASNGAIMIDSSYNSSPESLKQALNFLKGIDGKRKVAVIGDMNELGVRSQLLHEELGTLVPECASLLLTVGEKAKFLADKAIASGMDERKVHKFKTVKAATDFFEENIQKNDVILVKGSQNKIRLERFVKHFMKDQDEAKDLLVRQDKYWLNKI